MSDLDTDPVSDPTVGAPGEGSDGVGAPGEAADRAGDPADPPLEAATVPETARPSGLRTALVSSVTLDLPNQHPTVVLRESETPRRQLSFSIGFPDAVVLSHAFRRIATPRPLTHELMSSVLQRFDVDIVAVRIVGRRGTVYFAELDLRGRSVRSVHSCRPSDALTLALLQPVPVPILVDERLLEGSGDVEPRGAAG